MSKWTKGQDYTAEAPSNNCPGCPGISLTAPLGLASAGYQYTLPSSITHLEVQGTISDLGSSNCGASNDMVCNNEWRIWPPGSGDGVDTTTPGGENQGSLISFDGSFLCGTSRVVIVAENTYGLTRAIFEVTRSGGLCAVSALSLIHI